MNIFQHSVFTDREQIASAIYGKIIITAIIVALESHSETAFDAFVALISATVALFLAHFYADMLALDITTKKLGYVREAIPLIKKILPLAVGINGPAVIFLLSHFGLFSTELAFRLAKLTALIMLFIYGYLLGRATNSRVSKSVIAGVLTTTIGALVIAVKIVTH